MGITIPDESQRDANKVDAHLRTLLALEGRSTSPLASNFGFAKVELPDFDADQEKKAEPIPLPSKPSFNTNNSLAGKRDSFGKLLTPSSGPKKELQTLLEEDEGEDSSDESSSAIVPVPATRHRPRSLNLRSSLIKAAASSGPLPTPTPTPVRTPKLKSLTLASSSVVSSLNNTPKRSSTLVISQSTPLLSAAELEHAYRQSSISYRKPTLAPHPDNALFLSPTNTQTLTPGPSPTIERHNRSMTPTELLAQSSYFTQSHASFLARIAELEAALARATAASPAVTEPSEELLEMLADLKTERDQLKRSLDELSSRYQELEKQILGLNRRLDNEKRDAWVSKEKLSRAETENRAIVQENEGLKGEVAALRQQLQSTRTQLQAEKEAHARTEKELMAAMETPKVPAVPYPYPTSYHRPSQDSQSEAFSFNFSIKPASVDMQAYPEEEDRDSDGSFHSRSVSSTSYSSGLMSHHRPSSITTPDDASHRDSLSAGWSFASATKRARPKQSVDRFFACLEDSDGGVSVEPVSAPSQKSFNSPNAYSIGFGFTTSEDDDSSLNFGQPASPSPFPRSDESDGDDEILKPTGPVPFLDDEDASFTFATPAAFGTSPSSNLAFALVPESARSPPPPLSPAKYEDPTCPKPRHRARDSMHLRRRSKSDRSSESTRNSHTAMVFTPQDPSSNAETVDSQDDDDHAPGAVLSRSMIDLSSPSHSAAPSADEAIGGRTNIAPPSLLDVFIPSHTINTSLPSFEVDSLFAALSSSPPRKVVSPLPPQPQPQVEGTARKSRPSLPNLSFKHKSPTGSTSRIRLSQSSNTSHGRKESLPPSPTSPSARSPLSSLSFAAALVNLIPSSWSPRTNPSTPTSSAGRASLERAVVSREKQLNRLRDEIGSGEHRFPSSRTASMSEHAH